MHDLSLTKTVTGKYGDRDKVFHFRLDMEQSWGTKLNRTCGYSKPSGETGTVTIKNGLIEKLDGAPADAILLKHGQGITIKDLPEGCQYTITEEPKAGYTATEKVDGTDYIPIAATAVDNARTAKLDKDSSNPKTSIETGTATLKDVLKKMDSAQASPTALRQSSDPTGSSLSVGGKDTAAGEAPTRGVTGEKQGGVSLAGTVDGVVKGTIHTANVKVDYFNDKSTLAPPTGIDPNSGNSMLPAILAVLIVLGTGFSYWKRKKAAGKQRID